MRILLFFTCLMLHACTITESHGKRKVSSILDDIPTLAIEDESNSKNSGSNPADSYPKASEDADIIYNLESNMERTHFYVDSIELGAARRLTIKINNQEHNVIAKPDNCTKKEDFIRPPYNSYAPLRFTFLVGECYPPNSKPVAHSNKHPTRRLRHR